MLHDSIYMTFPESKLNRQKGNQWLRGPGQGEEPDCKRALGSFVDRWPGSEAGL